MITGLRQLQQKTEQDVNRASQELAALKAERAGPLLGVKANKLKADDEMRRIFGSRVVDAEARSTQAGGMVGGSRRVRR